MVHISTLTKTLINNHRQINLRNPRINDVSILVSEHDSSCSAPHLCLGVVEHELAVGPEALVEVAHALVGGR